MKIGEEHIKTETGVPQGSCISPILFNLYIDDLIKKLNEETSNKTWAFADDIVVVTENKEQLRKVMEIINQWSSSNSININKAKSGIMIIR